MNRIRRLIRGWATCLLRGHSRHVVFSYRYWDDARPSSLIDLSCVARCARCSAQLPAVCRDGVVTMGKYRMERDPAPRPAAE